MHGELNVSQIMRQAHREAETVKQLKQRRPPDEDTLKHNRRINAQTHGVIYRYQHHRITQLEAQALIHELEHQLG